MLRSAGPSRENLLQISHTSFSTALASAEYSSNLRCVYLLHVGLFYPRVGTLPSLCCVFQGFLYSCAFRRCTSETYNRGIGIFVMFVELVCAIPPKSYRFLCLVLKDIPAAPRLFVLLSMDGAECHPWIFCEVWYLKERETNNKHFGGRAMCALGLFETLRQYFSKFGIKVFYRYEGSEYW